MYIFSFPLLRLPFFSSSALSLSTLDTVLDLVFVLSLSLMREGTICTGFGVVVVVGLVLDLTEEDVIVDFLGAAVVVVVGVVVAGVAEGGGETNKESICHIVF